MRSALLVASLLLSSLAVLIPRGIADTLFHYTSESGDYIGKGQERTIIPSNGYTFGVNGSGINAVSFYINGTSTTTYESYGLQFAAPAGSNLTVGNYPGATRYPFEDAGSPGLNFDANGSGSNELTGQFQVLEISFDANGNLATFAANFVQHSEGAAPASYGQIRYNSSIPATTPSGVGQLAANQYSVIETAGSLTVTATRRDGSTGPLSVNYSTADGTDLAGRDYTAVSGTLFWADGDAANKTFTVPILNSGNPTQGNGTFFVNLSGASAGAQTQAAVTVINDNSAVTFVHFVSDSGDYIGQGEERTFNIADGFVLASSRNYDGGVSFSFNNNASAGVQNSEFWSIDFASATGTVFGVGDYQDAQRFPFQESPHPGLDISGDGRGSNTLTGNFQVLEAAFDSNGNVLKFAANFEQHSEGAVAALRGQVRYNSTVPLPAQPGIVQFSAATYSVAENAGAATITATRTGGSAGALSVNYTTVDGSAVSGVNYTPAVGTLAWADGDSASKTFTVPVSDDGNYTVDLSLALQLSGTGVGALSQATLILVNQDPFEPGIEQFSGANYQAKETDAAATITVNRTGGSNGSASVQYSTADGTALNGVNYSAVAGTLTWADGDTAPKTFAVPLLDPVTGLTSQTVLLNLTGSGVGMLAQATLTITNSNFPPVGTLALSTVNYTANESDTTATITVTRAGGSYGALSVNYTTLDGTALAGRDYIATSGTLTWVSGDSSPKLFTVPILDAQVSDGGRRTLMIQLTGSNLGLVPGATLTITDNDVAPLPQLSVAATTPKVDEDSGSQGVFNVVRTGPTTAPLTVVYKVAGSAANGVEYQMLSGTKVIKAGKAFARVKVRPIDTGVTGSKAKVKLTIIPQDGIYTVGEDNKAKVVILQND